MKHAERTNPKHASQRGASTLLMATIILIVIGIAALYSSRSSVVNQRVAANAIWSKQATDVAQAAMDNLTAFNATQLQTLAKGNATLTFTNDPANSTSGVIKNDPAIVVPVGMIYTATLTSTDAFKTTEINLDTRTANSSATQKLVQKTTFGSFLKELPLATITVRGDIEDPPKEKCCIAELSPATKEELKKPLNKGICPKKAAMMSKTVKGLPASPIPAPGEKAIAKITPPVGSSFSLLTPDQFETDYFSDSRAHLMETAQHYVDCKHGDGCNNSDIKDMTGFIWIEGDLKLNGGTPVGNFGSKATSAIDGGVDSTPVLLIVNGQLEMKNDAVVNGLVYVRGNWDNKNKAGKINGALLVNGTGDGSGADLNNQAGNLSGTDSLKIIHNLLILKNVQKLGSHVRIAGTWRDF